MILTFITGIIIFMFTSNLKKFKKANNNINDNKNKMQIAKLDLKHKVNISLRSWSMLYNTYRLAKTERLIKPCLYF